MIIDVEFHEASHILDAEFKVYDLSGEGGGGGNVDQTYNPESYNAQSGIALAPVFQDKLGIWKPNEKYRVGDIVVANLLVKNEFETVLLICDSNHTSPNKEYLDLEEANETWEIGYIHSEKAESALQDGLLNVIHDTYATKKEVENVVRYDENGYIASTKGKFEDLLVRGADSGYEEVATKKELQTQIGNIETTLDSIISIQENLIGGGNV